jgi:hypothetical protein
MTMLLVPEQRLAVVRNRVIESVPVRDIRSLAWYEAGEAKYGELFWVAEGMKNALRRDYVTRPRSDWRGFWAEYEQINRDLLPEDPVYTGTRSGVTLATSTDLWTLTSPGSGQTRVLEHYLGGESTSSTVLRFAIQRSTGGTTATNQTPELMNTRSPAAASTFATGWVAQPTLSGSALLWVAINTFGGTDRWVPAPGEEIFQVNGELLSGRSASGTPVVSSHLVWEEL